VVVGEAKMHPVGLRGPLQFESEKLLRSTPLDFEVQNARTVFAELSNNGPSPPIMSFNLLF
jgi:hypothetical protein